MELDITPLFADKLDAFLISGSQWELGANAAKITWQTAMNAAEEFPLITDENKAEVISWLRSWGAWSLKELEGFSRQELGALVWQFAATDLRENWTQLDIEDGDEEALAGLDIEGSNIFFSEGKFFFQLY
jgi:hypothetical protein